jgi:predicted DNA-binding protein
MMGKKLSIRIKEKESERLRLLCEKFKESPSQTIRRLLVEDRVKEIEFTGLLAELKNRLEENDSQLQRLEELGRFTASLLAGLTRRSAKSDPGEAEKMIQTARREVVAHREGKAKPVSDKDKN